MRTALTSARLKLLPSGELSATLHLPMLQDKELLKYSEQRHISHTLESQIKYVNSFDHKNHYLWDIFKQDDGTFVGTISAFIDSHNEVADVGILIRLGHQGYGTEVWKTVCDWLLDEGCRKVEAGCMNTNKPMIRIFEKTGMGFEGYRPWHFMVDDQPIHLYLAGRFA